ncbi:type II secretion system protein N [Sphingomicrobium marinum]|uniref:type II secretion system protein N n=1 Tax=Sphingomicrobium marinum TaxID=1227950 RepID=UPI0022409134|nr:type II secretion system protein N [Sphingomicrobium marinum]
MKLRWWLFGAAIFLIGLIAMFPLHVAMDMSMSKQSLLSARQVGGSVWNGRVGDAMLGEERLGTFDVALRPLSLLTGSADVAIERIGGLDGPLIGTLALDDDSQGVRDMNGSIGVATLMAPLPVDRLILTEATILFDEERCVEASGTLAAEASLGLLGLSRNLSGPLSCTSDGRLQADLSGGSETLTLIVNREGGYEAQLAIANAPPLVASGLALAGFTLDGSTLRLTHQGTLR